MPLASLFETHPTLMAAIASLCGIMAWVIFTLTDSTSDKLKKTVSTIRHANGVWATETQLSPGKATAADFGKAVEAICAGNIFEDIAAGKFTCRVCKSASFNSGAKFCPKCGYTLGPRKTMRKTLLDLRDRMNRAGLPLADRKAYLSIVTLSDLDTEYGLAITSKGPGQALGFQLILSEEVPDGEIVAFIPDDDRTFRS